MLTLSPGAPRGTGTRLSRAHPDRGAPASVRQAPPALPQLPGPWPPLAVCRTASPPAAPAAPPVAGITAGLAWKPPHCLGRSPSLLFE